jgi:hypothetical protein
MGATWRIVHSVGRSDAPTDDDPPSIPTPLCGRLYAHVRVIICVCVCVCVRVRVTSAHRTRVMGARTPPIRDFSVVKARLISTHNRDVTCGREGRSSPAHDARSSRQNTTRHDDDVYRYEHPMRGQGARDTTDRVCSRTHASSPARSRRRTRAPIARMDWRRRGLGRGCVDAMG